MENNDRLAIIISRAEFEEDLGFQMTDDEWKYFCGMVEENVYSFIDENYVHQMSFQGVFQGYQKDWGLPIREVYPDSE